MTLSHEATTPVPHCIRHLANVKLGIHIGMEFTTTPQHENGSTTPRDVEQLQSITKFSESFPKFHHLLVCIWLAVLIIHQQPSGKRLRRDRGSAPWSSFKIRRIRLGEPSVTGLCRFFFLLERNERYGTKWNNHGTNGSVMCYIDHYV